MKHQGDPFYKIFTILFPTSIDPLHSCLILDSRPMENLLKNKKHPGFSLLEVMVAMAIMAITFMAVLDSQSVSISGASEAKFSTTAALLAQKKWPNCRS